MPKRLRMPKEFKPRTLAMRDPANGKEFYMLVTSQEVLDARVSEGWYEPGRVTPTSVSAGARDWISKFAG
jgi:hypothetical protein